MQTILRGNLSMSGFPFVSDFGGRSVVVPQVDQNYVPSSVNPTVDTDKDRGIPQISYCHNVMPVGQGYKSIDYQKVIAAVASPGTTSMIHAEVVKDAAGNKAILGFTSTGDIYILAVGSSAWALVADTGWSGTTDITFATVYGSVYVCLRGTGVFKVNIVAGTLTNTPIAGVTTANLFGITSSNNYLIAWDATTIYWSAADNPEDMVPSLITGAGSAIPNDLDGQIVTCAPTTSGFVIHTTSVAIGAVFSGNTKFPWLFKAVPFSSGLTSPKLVTRDVSLGYQYVYTFAGMQRIDPRTSTLDFPELTDFLSGKIFEDYNYTRDEFSLQYLTKPLLTELSFIGSRFFVVSYGVDELTHALVYDTAFKRWGKLKITHVHCMELDVGVNKGSLTYTELAGTAYFQYQGKPYTLLSKMSNEAADTKANIGFAQKDGTVMQADFTFGAQQSDAVMMLGKFQIVRNQFLTLEQFEIEGVEETTSNFFCKFWKSMDGKNYETPVTPVQTLAAGKLRRYNSSQTGMNHSVTVKGAFHATTVIFTFSKQGRA